MVDYPWPTISDSEYIPVWTGNEFQIGEKGFPILAYDVGKSGWTDGLTQFHEETAGSDHFIDLASRQHALEQLHKYLKASKPAILEIGCSSGQMLQLMKVSLPDAFVIGSDYIREPLEHLANQLHNIPLLQFNLLKCPLPSASLDAVVLLNVLEHIEDDAEAIRQLYRILKPGGLVIIEVPTGQKLYDVYDELLLHYRRYNLTQLASLFEKANFQVLERSHLGFAIYPGFWLVKQRNKRFLSHEQAAKQNVVANNIRATRNNRILEKLMKVELAFGKKIAYPFGIRGLLTCIK